MLSDNFMMSKCIHLLLLFLCIKSLSWCRFIHKKKHHRYDDAL